MTDGKVFQIFRIAADLTIADLAASTKISAPFISRVESNQKRFSEQRLKIIFDFYNIPVADFKRVQSKAVRLNWSYQKTLRKALELWCANHPDY